MSDDFRESLLKAHANKDFICAQFTEVLRDLVRVIAVRDDPSAPVSRAAHQWALVQDLIYRCEERISIFEMFSVAVDSLREPDEPGKRHDQVSAATLRAARTGISLYIEASCCDNAAKGRISQRERNFLSAIKWIKDD
jgi:hypothetical protein